MARVAWRIIRNLPLLCCLLAIIGAGDPPQPGKVLDEARQAGRSAASLPAPLEDYFHDMDGGADLKPDPATKLNPVLGRNTWLVWSGGNDRFWDKMTRYTFGAEPFINRVIQPRIQYRINNGIPTQPIQNQDELWLELHFFF